MLQGDDRIAGSRGADHQVGLEQRLAQAVERPGAAAPSRRDGLGPLGLRFVTRIVPGLSPLRCCSVVSPIFPAPMTSTVLSAKESKTSRATSTATLATEGFPWSMPVWRTALPIPQRRLEDLMEDRPDRLARDGRLVGVADLAEDLPLAQHEALQAGRDAEQVPDGPLVAVADQVSGDRLDGDSVEPDQGFGELIRPWHGVAAPARYSSTRLQVDRITASLPGKVSERALSPSSHRGPSKATPRGPKPGRMVVNPHGQQSHGDVILPATVAVTAQFAVGSRSASTPTQAKTRNPKATIVSIIMLRPRLSG